MTSTFIVIDQLNDWSPFVESEQVLDFDHFITPEADHPILNQTNSGKIQIINLSQDYSYLSKGYYCSLLAESRGYRVSPSLKTLGMLNRPEGLSAALPNLSFGKPRNEPNSTDFTEILSVFGNCREESYQRIARQTYGILNFPLIRLIFNTAKNGDPKSAKNPQLVEIRPESLNRLNDDEESFFAHILEKHSRSIWRVASEKKTPSLSLAILIDDEEAFPPSDKKALKQFRKIGTQMGIDVSFLRSHELARLGEFDALFIRATTAVNHFTYAFAVEAKRLGIAVIDDPDSILRCTNKVYLMQLLEKNQVQIPKTTIFSKDQDLRETLPKLDYPTVLKIPDGSFSRGILKASNPEECELKLNELFKGSELVLQQEYLYTDFDWRIGILNKSPIYACNYAMVKGHWQIIKHNDNKKRNQFGDSSTVAIRQVPPIILKTAIHAASLIGDGLYGVDLKLKDGKAYVIEVNDNPSIDYGIEDAVIGDELYRMIMLDFLRRIYQKGNERSYRNA